MFALNYITSPALLTATEAWTIGGRSAEGNALIEALRTHAGPAYVGFRVAREKLVAAIAARATEDPEALRIDGLNARYDETGRGIRSGVKGARDATNDPRLEGELTELDRALFPEAGRHWQKSMADQGGDAEVRASAVTARHRELLRGIVFLGTNLEQYLDEHLSVGQALRGAVGAADAAAAAAATAPSRVLPRAKAKLIKTIRTVIGTLEENPECPREMLERIVGPLQQAAERAQADALARRGSGGTGTGGGTPGTPPAA